MQRTTVLGWWEVQFVHEWWEATRFSLSLACFVGTQPRPTEIGPAEAIGDGKLASLFPSWQPPMNQWKGSRR